MIISIALLVVAGWFTGRLVAIGWTRRFAARSRLQLVDSMVAATLMLVISRVSITAALAPVWLVLMLLLGVGVAGVLLRWRRLPWDAQANRSPRPTRVRAIVSTAIGAVVTVGLAVALV